MWQRIPAKVRQTGLDERPWLTVSRDALHRHELTHQASGPSLLSKGIRACTACAAAKTRCSGELPCSRCHQREVQCSYPDLVAEQEPHVQGDAPSQSSQIQVGRAVDSTLDFQHSLNPLPPGISLPFGSSNPTFDSDYWDPSILSTTNWLDAVIDDGFQGLHFDFDIANSVVDDNVTPARNVNLLPSWQATNQTGRGQMQFQVASPAVTSNTSARSAISTETAAEICAAQEASTHSVGEYYVDGEPARLPRTKRRKLSSHSQAELGHNSRDSTFSLHLAVSPDTELKHRIHIPDAMYQQFCNMWQQACVDTRLLWPTFEATGFPSTDVLEHLLGLYFAHFHQTLPFLHPSSFSVDNAHPMLLLAMVGIGAQFFDECHSAFAISISEIVRRNLVLSKEDLSQPALEAATLAQVQMLLAVSFVYSGDKTLTSRGFDMQQSLTAACVEITKEVVDLPEMQPESEEAKWKTWIERGQIVRTCYCIWLLDCMWAYQFQRHTVLALSDAILPLPCHEKQWRAGDAEEWANLRSGHISTPSLKDALLELYIDKRLPRDRGEFARIIMIHGLFQRTWEVERYYANPLTHWEPTAKKQSSRDVLPPEPVSLLSLPGYTKWQNSVCDCIDILHWQANATIGQASGLEHPTVAFLHLSRVVLLSPISAIVRYTKTLIGLHKASLSTVNVDKKTIHRWATQGQYKARLAAIHAGVVFWHIRRYSIDAFYEAPAVALAALMLWAFGEFAPRQTSKRKPKNKDQQETTSQPEASRSESPTGGSDDSACGIILIDRPTDDELVQQFIRRGQSMRVHITGVGDLYGAQGPSRVLLEGCKLLQSLKCWGLNETWLDILQQLQQNCVQETQQ